MRRTTKLAVGLGVVGALVFAAGAGTSAAIAVDAKQRTEREFGKVKQRAFALYDDDVNNQKKLARVQDQVTSAHGAMVAMKNLLGDAPWLASETREQLDDAIVELGTYGQDSAPGDPLPKPPAGPDEPSLTVLPAQIDLLREYALDHEEDHDATERAIKHLNRSLGNATSVLREVALQSVLAGRPLPQA